MTKRILSALLAALMLLPVLGCAGDNTPGDTSAPVDSSAPTSTDADTAVTTEPPIISAALPSTRFDGYTFTVAGFDNTVISTLYVEEQTGDTVNDALVDRNRLIEETYGVSVVGSTMSGDFTASIAQAVSSGDTTYSLISGHDCTLFGLTMGGYFRDLRRMPHMDFSQPWYPSYANDTYAIGGRQYMMTSYLSFLALSWAQCIFINKGIAADIGLTVPYADVQNGTWTLDRMIELSAGAAHDLNADGTMNADDRYALAANYKLYSFQGAYLDCYARDSDGKITLEFDQERLIALCEKMVAYLTGSDGYITGAEPASADALFINGQSLFTYSKLQEMTRDALRESEVEYGVLPIPKWDTAQKDYISSTSDRQFAVLTTCDNAERAGILIEALSSAGYNMLRPAYFEVALSTRFTPDRESSEMLEIISNTLACDLSFLNTTSGTTGLGRTLMHALNTKSANLASYFRKIIPAEQKTVDKINEFYFREITE